MMVIRQKWKIGKRFYWGMAFLACIGSFGLGWIANKVFIKIDPPHPLRLGGYQYISPLLSCNFNATKIFSQNGNMVNTIQSVVGNDKNSGNITQASVYFADFTGGEWANVNGDAEYYPASLGKVPIMMAYFLMAENTSSILNDQIMYPANLPDQNAQQEISPENAIIPGKEYSVQDMIKYMIKYSDNNAAEALSVNADQSSLKSVYSDLQIPLAATVTASTSDIMTAQQYSILFRTLYNSTYLSRDFSEEALGLMTQTTFTQGLVAGVPSSTVVSHKYGLASYLSGLAPYQWELHDCGIVYAPGHPYLLCIMTKGTTSIVAQEKTIADISAAVYKEVENGYQ